LVVLDLAFAKAGVVCVPVSDMFTLNRYRLYRGCLIHPFSSILIDGFVGHSGPLIVWAVLLITKDVLLLYFQGWYRAIQAISTKCDAFCVLCHDAHVSLLRACPSAAIA